MKNFGIILMNKFSSTKPASGSKLFAGSFGDLMKEDFPTVKPSLKPPATSEKEYMYDKSRGIFYKYIWQDGKFKKGFKLMPWMKHPSTIG